jgi:hypothetical protein
MLGTKIPTGKYISNSAPAQRNIIANGSRHTDDSAAVKRDARAHPRSSDRCGWGGRN